MFPVHLEPALTLSILLIMPPKQLVVPQTLDDYVKGAPRGLTIGAQKAQFVNRLKPGQAVANRHPVRPLSTRTPLFTQVQK